jgi:shikimate kinase
LEGVRAAEAKAVAAVGGGATESEKVRRIMASARILEA